MDAEPVLSVEDAWLLRLDLDALTDHEVAEIKRYYRALTLRAPRDFAATREAIKRVRDCEDIVHGWDDPNDFSMWKGAFEHLKHRKTANPDSIDVENGAPLRQDNGGPTDDGEASCS